jgi:hypothetical protein
MISEKIFFVKAASDEMSSPSQNNNSNNPFPLINLDTVPSNQPSSQFLQPQPTSFNPFWQQQQANQEALQVCDL